MKVSILIFTIVTKEDTVIEYAIRKSLVSKAYGLEADQFYKDEFNKWFLKNVYNHYMLWRQFKEAKIEADADFSKFLGTQDNDYNITVHKGSDNWLLSGLIPQIKGRFVNFTVSIKASDFAD